ncbi:hypothetical protein BTVI_107646 [Pitangus sulphuratus]|nr:hypothetical protein BTVI_107646 [Pitangus sulphuratus]
METKLLLLPSCPQFLYKAKQRGDGAPESGQSHLTGKEEKGYLLLNSGAAYFQHPLFPVIFFSHNKMEEKYLGAVTCLCSVLFPLAFRLPFRLATNFLLRNWE